MSGGKSARWVDEDMAEVITSMCRSPARHLGIRAFQDIFTTHEDRLFHWVEDRRVPAATTKQTAIYVQPSLPERMWPH